MFRWMALLVVMTAFSSGLSSAAVVSAQGRSSVVIGEVTTLTAGELGPMILVEVKRQEAVNLTCYGTPGHLMGCFQD